LHAADYGFWWQHLYLCHASSVYGLLPICKQIVLLMNLSTTASVYPASIWDFVLHPEP
jgi:hypothetical protein